MRIYYRRSSFKKIRTRILKRMIDDETWYRIWDHKKNDFACNIWHHYPLKIDINSRYYLMRLLKNTNIEWPFLHLISHIFIYIYIYIYIRQLRIDHDKKRSSYESKWFRSFESCSDSSVNSYWWSDKKKLR